MSRNECYDKYWENPDDDKCYDKYWMNPTEYNEDTGIYDMKTRLTFDDEEDGLTDEDLNQMAEAIRMGVDWTSIAKIMSKEMPGMSWMLERGLRKAFYEDTVQESLKSFLTLLTQTADRRMLVNPEREHVSSVCGECDSPEGSHASWCPIEHWNATANRRSKKKLKKRRNPTTKKKKRGKKRTTKCKACSKNIQQSGRGRPKLYHSRCKKKKR